MGSGTEITYNDPFSLCAFERHGQRITAKLGGKVVAITTISTDKQGNTRAKNVGFRQMFLYPGIFKAFMSRVADMLDGYQIKCGNTKYKKSNFFGINIQLTTHAKERIKQRKLPDPRHVELLPATKTQRRYLRNSCAKSYRQGNTYYRSPCDAIYVCDTKPNGTLLVITAFRYTKAEKKY